MSKSATIMVMRVLAGSLFFLLVAPALAQVTGADIPIPSSLGEGIKAVESNLVTPANSGLAKGASVATYIKNIILFLLSLVAVLGLLALVVGGLMYILSLGDESKAEHAKKIILYAIIGILVVGGSFMIIYTIGGFLGV